MLELYRDRVNPGLALRLSARAAKPEDRNFLLHPTKPKSRML